MNDIGVRVFLSLSLSLAGCANDPSDEGSPDVDIERDCQTFCDQAVSCPPGNFAMDWEFESASECVDACLSYTDFGIRAYPSHQCEIVTPAMWACAGALPTCDDFAQFEKAAFAMTDGLLGEPCGEEIIDFLMLCN